MKKNITSTADILSPATSKVITQADLEQDYNYFQAQKVSEMMLNLGLISLPEFKKLSQENRNTFSPLWVEIMPEIR